MAEKKTQERGNLRRMEMVAAARKLLAERELDEIALTDIADCAAIPKSSAYHLFSTTFDVLAAVAREIAAELKDHMASVQFRTPAGWPELVEAFVRHGATYFNVNRDAAQLLLGPKSPPSIKTVDREQSDAAIGIQLMVMLESHFVLPEWPTRDDVFFRAVEIADLFFSLSVMRHHHIDLEYEQEAVRATQAYLSLYLPPILPHS